jgi:hypothetical protein
MVVKMARVLVFVLVMFLAIPHASFAEHAYEITVTIGDTTLNSSSPHTSVPIAGNYTHAATGGSITIANVGAGGATAKVELTAGTSDNTIDSIRLINARITATNSSVTNFPITFKRRMISGPDTPPVLYYKLSAKGLFQQASGSSIYLGWFGKNPVTNGFFFLNSTQYTPGSTSFNLTPAGKAWPTPPNMTGDRVPKVEFTVKLTNGKWLDFETVAQSRMIKLYSSPSPDQTPPCHAGETDCIRQSEPSMYLPYQFEAEKCVRNGEMCNLPGRVDSPF